MNIHSLGSDPSFSPEQGAGIHDTPQPADSATANWSGAVETQMVSEMHSTTQKVIPIANEQLSEKIDLGYHSDSSRSASPALEKQPINGGDETLVQQVQFEGKKYAIKELIEVGEGSTGVAHLISIAKKVLKKIGEEVVLKKIKEHLPSGVHLKAEESLKRGYEIHLLIRGGKENAYLVLEGIQNTPHLVTILRSDGTKLGQLGKFYSGGSLEQFFSMNVPEGEMLTEKQLQQRAPEIHGLFAGIVKGHIELLKHNVFQNDYNLGNYYVDENKRACIGDLDSCYIFGGQNERINLPTAWTSYNDSIDFFKNPSVEKAKQMVVFATGCQLYDALKGKLPFALEEGDFAIDDSRRYPIIPQELLADCDPFIAKMMSLDPSQRPSLEEVYDYLAIHSGEVIPGELDKLFAAS